MLLSFLDNGDTKLPEHSASNFLLGCSIEINILSRS